MLPNNFVTYIYHADCAHDLHSIIQSELIARRKYACKRRRQTVFFAAVDPLNEHLVKEQKLRRVATTSCTSQIEMEGAWERSTLGQPTGSSEEGIDIFPDSLRQSSSMTLSQQSALNSDYDYDCDCDSPERGLQKYQPCPTDSDRVSWPQQKESVKLIQKLVSAGSKYFSWDTHETSQLTGCCCREFFNSWIHGFTSKERHHQLSLDFCSHKLILYIFALSLTSRSTVDQSCSPSSLGRMCTSSSWSGFPFGSLPVFFAGVWPSDSTSIRRLSPTRNPHTQSPAGALHLRVSSDSFSALFANT